MNRLVLITGASAGLGAAFAERYAVRGWDLALTGRRTDRLQALAADLSSRFGVETIVLPADLADPFAPRRLAEDLTARSRHVDALVNNAGYGLRGAFTGQSAGDQRALLEVLTGSVVALTHALLPGMQARGYGRVLNVSSVMGLLPGAPRGALYSAAKTFVVAFSEGLHLENRDTGVHVSCLCPGLTRTEFHQVAGMTDEIAAVPRWMWMKAAKIAEAGVEAVEANRPLSVPGAVNKAVVAAAKIMPTDWSLALTERVMRRLRD